MVIACTAGMSEQVQKVLNFQCANLSSKIRSSPAEMRGFRLDGTHN